MLKIVINDIERDFDASSIDNLGNLFKCLLDEFSSQESHVTKIRLNGEELSENDIQAKGNLPVQEIEELELSILSMPEIALNNINNAMEYLNKLIPAVTESSELFRTKSAEEANQHFIECIEGLTWFQEVIEIITIALKEELESPNPEHKNISKLQQKMLQLVKDISDSQEKKDWVMLADLLEYELTPVLEEWASILPLFVNAAKKKINSSEN